MSDTIPVAQLRAFVERIERIEADIKDLNGDKSEVYKELRGCGFDVKAVRAVVAKRKLDTADREERDAMFDLYWSALNGTGTEDSTRVHVHEAGLSYSQSGLSYAEEKGRGEADTSHGKIPVLEPGEMDRATEGSFETGSEAAENARKAIPAGPEDGSVIHAGAGEIPATNSNSPAAIPLGAANSAGEAPSSPASPARHSDEDIPAFLRRDEGRGHPKRESVEA